MKLMYSPGACSIGIHVLLEEIGKPYEAQLVNLREGGAIQAGLHRRSIRSRRCRRWCATTAPC